MITCPEHGSDCRWYQHSNTDTAGCDLGVGDGIRNGIEFAQAHAPMESHLYPVSNGRGDYFALGFLTGLVRAWCPDHETSNCLGTHRCWVKVQALLVPELTERAS